MCFLIIRISYLYRLSYLWYAGLAMAVVFSVGILVSLLTGPIDSSTLNENLFFNFKRLSFCGLMHRKKRNSPFEVNINKKFDLFSTSIQINCVCLFLKKSFEGENNLAMDLVKDYQVQQQKGSSLKKMKTIADDSIIITSL